MGNTYRELLDEYPIRFSRTAAFIQEYLTKSRGLVLDVGCSEGYYLRMVVEPEYRVGLDISANLLSKAGDIHKVCGSVDYPPFRAGIFDMLFCFEAIGYASGVQSFMEDAKRLLRMGGILLISTHAEDSTIQRAMLQLAQNAIEVFIRRSDNRVVPPRSSYKRYSLGALAKAIEWNDGLRLLRTEIYHRFSWAIRRMIPLSDLLILAAGRILHLDLWMVHELYAVEICESRDDPLKAKKTEKEHSGIRLTLLKNGLGGAALSLSLGPGILIF